MNDVSFISAHRLADEIANRRISSEAAVAAFLERIAATDSKYHAFLEVYRDDALTAARAADLSIRSGHVLGPLHGVPVALKDLIDFAGRTTTSGSTIWRDRRVEGTARLVKHLLRAGLIILGKTQLVEFATGGWGTNNRMGTPWNPWSSDVPLIPGGSSSGSAVAVAAGLVPWAVGTDSGGSVRLPASFCGITGLKVTVGQISTAGIQPLSESLDTPGPMARSVEDVALLFQALRGEEIEMDAPDGLLAEMRRGVRGMRFARLPDAERSAVTADVLFAYDTSLAVLETLGATIVDCRLPCAFAALASLTGEIMAAEGYANLGAIVDDETLALDEDVRPRLSVGAKISSRQYICAVKTRERLQREFNIALVDVDALLTPTTWSTAFPIDQVDQSTQPSLFTRAGNFLDFAALAIPNGRSAAGLPTSLQVLCKSFEEATALRIGWAYQNATEWHLRRPAELVQAA